MNRERNLRDLVVLVADKDMEAAVRSLLTRREALGIREVSYEIYSHPSHDPGCRTDGPTFLRNFCRQFEHAIVLFDHEGSGADDIAPVDLEQNLEELLARNGWRDRAAAIVLDPELEIWVWTNSGEVDQVLGWSGRLPSLRQWLVEERYIATPSAKPSRPKEAFRHALRHVRKQPSSALFRQLAQRVSFRNCTDRAFQKLQDRLVTWFGASQS
jgi:hypothetical protein